MYILVYTYVIAYDYILLYIWYIYIVHDLDICLVGTRTFADKGPRHCVFFTGKRQEGHTVWREGVEGADVGLRACVNTCQPSHKTTHLPTPVTKRCLVFLWEGMFDIFDSFGWDSGYMWIYHCDYKWSRFFWWHDSLENILLIQIKHGRMTTTRLLFE